MGACGPQLPACYRVLGVERSGPTVEATALTHSSVPGLNRPSRWLRFQSDEKLAALTRRGQPAAFETLFSRYQSRLLSFCRHMLSSREDAEDVLQEVFTAAFNAVLADEREINVRPWLYCIARNRSLNHLRRASAVGVDSMDIHFAEGGISTGEQVLRRESFRQLIGDVQQLPETHCYKPIIRRNTPLPLTRTERYMTSHPYQTEVDVQVYQGDDEDALKNILVGDFRVEGLTAMEDANEILCRMRLDLDGILEVAAVEKRTGKTKHIRIANALRAKSAEEIAAGRKRIQELYETRGEMVDDAWEKPEELQEERRVG